MNFGRHQHWVTFQAPVYSKNAQGEERITSWVDTISIWASIKPLTGRELQFALQQVEQVSHEVRLRYVEPTNPIDSTMRIECNPLGGSRMRYLQIGAVYSPDESGDELVCLCTEVKQ